MSIHIFVKSYTLASMVISWCPDSILNIDSILSLIIEWYFQVKKSGVDMFRQNIFDKITLSAYILKTQNQIHHSKFFKKIITQYDMKFNLV